MAWENISSTAIDIKKHKGEAYEGTYRGSHEFQTKVGKQVIWEFTDKDGAPLGIYGFTNLNRAMESIEAGTVLRITYTGTQNVQTRFGMKDVHQIQVQIWKGEKEDDLPF